jgi:Fe-Mn family superoxide dismutase
MKAKVSRRQALKNTTLAAATLAARPRLMARADVPHKSAHELEAAAVPHQLPLLRYAYDALEPHFDARTMEIHYSKHHAAYVANLNKALARIPDLQKLSLEQLLKSLDQVPGTIRATVRNNAGGHFNHSLFWQTLKRDYRQTQPEGILAEALGELFEDEAHANESFLHAALSVFGSGWVWISFDANRKLRLETTLNQDNPLMFGRQPLLGLDVWEHAYYLKYYNHRAEYVEAFSKIIDWEAVQKRFESFVA